MRIGSGDSYVARAEGPDTICICICAYRNEYRNEYKIVFRNKYNDFMHIPLCAYAYSGIGFRMYIGTGTGYRVPGYPADRNLRTVFRKLKIVLLCFRYRNNYNRCTGIYCGIIVSG